MGFGVLGLTREQPVEHALLVAHGIVVAARAHLVRAGVRGRGTGWGRVRVRVKGEGEGLLLRVSLRVRARMRAGVRTRQFSL